MATIPAERLESIVGDVVRDKETKTFYEKVSKTEQYYDDDGDLQFKDVIRLRKIEDSEIQKEIDEIPDFFDVEPLHFPITFHPFDMVVELEEVQRNYCREGFGHGPKNRNTAVALWVLCNEEEEDSVFNLDAWNRCVYFEWGYGCQGWALARNCVDAESYEEYLKECEEDGIYPRALPISEIEGRSYRTFKWDESNLEEWDQEESHVRHNAQNELDRRDSTSTYWLERFRDEYPDAAKKCLIDIDAVIRRRETERARLEGQIEGEGTQMELPI